MKKYYNLIFLILLVFSLSSCFWEWTTGWDIEDTKRELLNWSEWTNIDSNVSKYEDETLWSQSGSLLNNKSDKIEKERYTVNYVWDNKFVEIDNLDNQDFENKKIIITWKTLVKVDKIVVNFTNKSSKFPDDTFQLKKFKSWDSTFSYNAFFQYQVLDYWQNEYIIEAYSWDEVSRVEVFINLPKSEESTSSTSVLNDSNKEDTVVQTTSESNIKNLRLSKIEGWLVATDSDSITNLLSKLTPANSWFYWNTSRNIKDTDWFSAYVLRLEKDSYVYEKYYYLPDGTFWILQLEKGTWVNKENIWDKNSELKDKNSQFDTIEADKYFKDKI